MGDQEYAFNIDLQIQFDPLSIGCPTSDQSYSGDVPIDVVKGTMDLNFVSKNGMESSILLIPVNYIEFVDNNKDFIFIMNAERFQLEFAYLDQEITMKPRHCAGESF